MSHVCQKRLGVRWFFSLLNLQDCYLPKVVSAALVASLCWPARHGLHTAPPTPQHREVKEEEPCNPHSPGRTMLWDSFTTGTAGTECLVCLGSPASTPTTFLQSGLYSTPAFCRQATSRQQPETGRFCRGQRYCHRSKMTGGCRGTERHPVDFGLHDLGFLDLCRCPSARTSLLN